MQYYAGIDLGGTKTEVIVLDENSQEHYRKRTPTPQHDYPATLNNITTLVLEAQAHLKLDSLPVGIGIPGTISRKTGCVKNANSTWLNGQAMTADMELLLKRPIKIMNDANCLAVSEAVDGAGSGHATVFAAILGTGCGAGISIAQQALIGPNGLAGEWGHITHPSASDAERNARPCYCGKTGCIETFISGTGLQTSYTLKTGENINVQKIIHRAEDGEKNALTILAQYQQQVVTALAMVVNLLDPDIIVLGGGVSNWPKLYPAINKMLPKMVFGKECDTQIVQSKHGDSSGVRGAAWLNLKPF